MKKNDLSCLILAAMALLLFSCKKNGAPNNGKWTTYSYPAVGGIAIDAQGNKWFGAVQGLLKLDDTTWTVYTTGNSGLAGNDVNGVTVDSKGNIWCGTQGEGVSKFDGTHWTTYNTSNSGLFNHATGVFGNPSGVLGIAIDAQGNMWFVGTEISEWQQQ